MNWKKRINRLWRLYNATFLRVVAPFPRTTICDPYFLYQFHFNRNLRAATQGLVGIVLDIGCGQKPYRLYFQSSTRYVGIDLPFYSGGIEDAVPATDAYGDGRALPIKDETVDTVVAFQVLEHTPEPAKIISEAHRVLRPAGTLVVTVPQSYPIHGEPYDFFRYTAYGIRYLLEQQGFHVKSIAQNGQFGAYLGLMLNKYIFQHFFEFRRHYATKAVLGVVKVALTPVLLVVIPVVNVLGLTVDLLHRDPWFTSNYTVVARK